MGNWNEESIIESLVKYFGKNRDEEKIAELREEIEGSLDLRKGRYSASAGLSVLGDLFVDLDAVGAIRQRGVAGGTGGGCGDGDGLLADCVDGVAGEQHVDGRH